MFIKKIKMKKDVYSAFMYDPVFKAFTLIPKDEFIFSYNVEERRLYFNTNPYGEEKNILVNKIVTNESFTQLEFDLIKNKSRKIIKVESSVNMMIIKLIHLLFNKGNKMDLSFKEQIEFEFENNFLENLVIKSGDKNKILDIFRITDIDDNIYFSIPRTDTRILIDNLTFESNLILIKCNNLMFKIPLYSNVLIIEWIKLFLETCDNTKNNPMNTLQESKGKLTISDNEIKFIFNPRVGFSYIQVFKKTFYYSHENKKLYLDMKFKELNRLIPIDNLLYDKISKNYTFTLSLNGKTESFKFMGKTELYDSLLNLIYILYNFGVDSDKYEDSIYFSMYNRAFNEFNITKVTHPDGEFVDSFSVFFKVNELGYPLRSTGGNGYIKGADYKGTSITFKMDKGIKEYNLDVPEFIADNIGKILNLTLK